MQAPAPRPETFAAAWTAALTAAETPAPDDTWRVRLATTVREAAGARLASVLTCPPGDWNRLRHDTVPPRYDRLIAAVEDQFLHRIDRAGEGWRFAVAEHGVVYAPLSSAVDQGLAGDLFRAVLAPHGIRSWVVGFFIAPAGMLLGLIVVGGDEDDATLLGRIRAPLAEVAGRAGLTLQTTLDLARGLGVTVPAGATSHPSLTARERQIATLIAQGYSNLNVSARLGIAADTVSVHVRRIYRKLGVHSRVELAARLASD